MIPLTDTQLSYGKSLYLADKNYNNQYKNKITQKQDIRWTMRKTVTITVIILITPLFIFIESSCPLKVLFILNNLSILTILSILRSLYNLGSLASRTSFAEDYLADELTLESEEVSPLGITS